MAVKSFALEYRKRLQAEEQKRQHASRSRQHGGYATHTGLASGAGAAGPGAVMGALIVAALIVAIFNSEALEQTARGLVDYKAGRELFALSQSWHDVMAARHATVLMEEMRELVSTARESSWADVIRGLHLEAFLSEAHTAGGLAQPGGTSMQ